MTLDITSELIREADLIAWQKWPNDHRHFTYVKPDAVKSSNPGYCFLMAGWRKCGLTKGGHIIMDIWLDLDNA